MFNTCLIDYDIAITFTSTLQTCYVQTESIALPKVVYRTLSFKNLFTKCSGMVADNRKATYVSDIVGGVQHLRPNPNRHSEIHEYVVTLEDSALQEAQSNCSCCSSLYLVAILMAMT